ncbi:MAG: hypothetical protein AAGH73_10885 [Pseudomonadota bacterium]
MSTLSQDRKRAWEERLARIESGRTMTQTAGAEGTVPMQLAKRGGGKVKVGMTGYVALIAGMAAGWCSAMLACVAAPSAMLLEAYDFGERAELIALYTDPLAAFLCFVVLCGILRMQSFSGKFFGLVIMAWVFGLQMDLGAPTVAEVVEFGKAIVAGEIAWSEKIADFQTWANESLA